MSWVYNQNDCKRMSIIKYHINLFFCHSIRCFFLPQTISINEKFKAFIVTNNFILEIVASGFRLLIKYGTVTMILNTPRELW